MSAATPWVAEVLPPVSDAVSFLAIAALVCSIYRFAEHLIMPLETRNILRRLNQKSKQIQKRSGVLGLWVERVEVWSFHFDGIVSLPAPFPVEIQALPAVADGGPDLAPSGLRSVIVGFHLKNPLEATGG
jgi:hypothetical protein